MTKKNQNRIIFLVFIIFSATRFINIEQDIPSFNQVGLSQTDEPYYNGLWPLNDFLKDNKRDFHSSQIKHDKKEIVLSISYPLIKMGVFLFGYNYIGLRFGVVCLSILSIFGLFLILKNMNHNFWFLLASIVWMFTDYYFLAISKVLNPHMYSIFGIVTFLFFATKKFTSAINIAIASCISLLIVVLIYPYNIFLPFGYFFFILFLSFNTKSTKPIASFLLGSIIAFLIFYVLLHVLNSNIQEYISYYTSFREVRDESISNPFSVKHFIESIFQMVYTNLIRYNVFYLLLIILLLYELIFKKSKNYYLLFTACIFLCAYIQGFFVVSYPFKKWVVLFPFFIILLPYLWELNIKLPIYLKLLLFIAFMLLSWYIHKVTSSFEFWSGFNYGYTYIKNKSIYNILYILLMSMGTYFLVQNKPKNIFIISISIGIMFTLKNQFIEAEFFHKDFLTELNSIEKHKKMLIIGDFSHAYSFYNNSVPLFNPYDFKTKDTTHIKSEIDTAQFQMYYIEKSKANLYNSQTNKNKFLMHENFLWVKKYSNSVYAFNVYKHVQ